MKEPYGKAVAPRTGPAPWRCVRKDVLQALVGVRAGWVLSREINLSGASRPFPSAEDTTCASLSLDAREPRVVVDPMHVRFFKKTLRTGTGRSHARPQRC